MEVIKKINNNVALGIDGNGNQVILMGKGIGFQKMPYRISSLSQVKKTFYNVDERYYGLFQSIPEEIILLSSEIVEYASLRLEVEFNHNLTLTLADHIAFSIERKEKGISSINVIEEEIRTFFKKELEVAKYALDLINMRLDVDLPEIEIISLCLHLMNAASYAKDMNMTIKSLDIMSEIFQIIEKVHDTKIDRDTHSFSRFVIHLKYLILVREIDKEDLAENELLHGMVQLQYPKAFEAASQISKYLDDKLSWKLNKNEVLYLMLHIHKIFN